MNLSKAAIRRVATFGLVAACGFAGSVAAQEPAAPLASQETNWAGIVADVTEFKRKGNTLTAKVRLRNTGSAKARPEVRFDDVYLLDTAAGKKYQVLTDEKDFAIASVNAGYSDQWFAEIQPTQSQLIWIKFPAPPADVKEITLRLEGMAPFDDLPIQDP